MSRPETEQQSSSVASIVFVGFLAVVAVVGIAALSVLWVGAGIVLGGVFFFAAFHYLVWGWWLSRMIREEDAAETGETGEAGQREFGSPRETD